MPGVSNLQKNEKKEKNEIKKKNTKLHSSNK